MVVGLPTVAEALPPAALVVGSRRHLDLVEVPAGTPTLVLGGDLGPVLDAIASEPGTVWVLASGDPGFFGIGRALAERLGPKPSTSGRRRRRSAWPSPGWGCRGTTPWWYRPTAARFRRPRRGRGGRRGRVRESRRPRLARESPRDPGQGAGCARRGIAGCCRLQPVGAGGRDRHPYRSRRAGRRYVGSLSVVVLIRGAPVAAAAQLAWGRPEATFAHRSGMVTKSEVRAVALGKLGLTTHGVLWDVGAGSGSVAIECALLGPDLHVFAIERDPDDAERIGDDARRLGAAVTVVTGDAPGVLAGLPDPDRAFVGGGGLDVLDAVRARLAPGGRVVATYAALDRAAAAAGRLGHLVQIAASRGERLPRRRLAPGGHQPGLRRVGT